MVALLLTSMLALAFSIQPVGASATIYIRADGSVEPQTANITSSDNVTYTFTDNNYGEIVVQRSNIVIDENGYTLQGSGNGLGFDVLGTANNVTVRKTNIEGFSFGVHIYQSSSNTFSGNNITNNKYGVYVQESSSNIFSSNTIANSTAPTACGFTLAQSSSNIFSRNSIAHNVYGIYLLQSFNNSFYHNNFVSNAVQVYNYYPKYANVWDDGYPSGGNYWSDYTDVDLYSGPYQNETGSDGIWDQPYVIDVDNQDHYPLMRPHPWGPHDIGLTCIVTSKTIVGQGYNVHINISIFNYGNNTETFNVTAYANTTIIDTLVNITLISGNATTLTFTWNTTGFAKGNYTISAYASPVLGETDTVDNSMVGGWVFITLSGDVDGDRDVDIFDIVMMAGIYGTTEEDPQYDPNCDIDGDGDIDIFDIVAAASNYGESW